MAELIAMKGYAIKMAPGILRDGTRFAKPNWIDGQWCRFYRGLPQKMGGYKQIPDPFDTTFPNQIPRGLFVLPQSPNFDVYVGDQDSVGFIPIDFFGNPVGGYVDRTPVAPPFAANPANQWQFDIMFSGVTDAGGTSVIVAFAAPNLLSIDNPDKRPIYYGPAYNFIPAQQRLIETGFSVAGGIVVLHPYLFMLDDAGLVIISQASNPTVELDSFRIAPYKLLAGRPVRGGNTSPAGLIWSTDRLIRVTQTGSTETPEWNFDTISAGISTMSSTCMVEYDTDYYWMGIDRFFYYNGIVQELPNDMNRNYIFDNLNYNQRQKVWATKDTEWGEVWWFYPSGNNLECDSAVIYNVREKTWYDTKLNRSCGYYNTVFAQPIWADNQINVANVYPLWLQDEGNNQVSFDAAGHPVVTAINSFITTGPMSWIGVGPDQQRRGMDRWISYYRFEPDFVQIGNMTMTITFNDYAASPAPTYTISGPYTFGPTTVKIDIDNPRQGRQSTITFTSNVIDGYFEMGEPILIATVGDGRQSVPGA
jgi:hypothetical protein